MLILDIYGNFLARNNPFLQVIRELDKRKDVKINLMGPVHQSLVHIQKRKYIKGDVALGFGYPREFKGMQEGSYQIKMGYTSWETTEIPYGSYYGSKKILEDLNLLLVPNEWNKKLFSSANKNIQILPLAYDHWAASQTRIKDDYFTFLCEGTLTLKLNVGLVISAFLSLYKDDPSTRLILKTDSGTLGHLQFPYENLEIIDKIYRPKQYLELLKRTDIFIYPASADSYPVPLLNALAAGIPTIAPSHSNFQYLPTIALNNHKLKPAQRYSDKFEDVGNYFDINYEELKKTMSEVRDENKLLDYIGDGNYFRKKHSVISFSNDIIKLLKKYHDRRRKS